MERSGGGGGGLDRMDNMTDSTGLCLQDLVVANGNNNNNNGTDHSVSLHNHHALHDSVSSAVSVSSAITSLMTPSSIGSGLSHLHPHGTHANDISGVAAATHHPHHHTPSLHEPLEKLKCK